MRDPGGTSFVEVLVVCFFPLFSLWNVNGLHRRHTCIFPSWFTFILFVLLVGFHIIQYH